MEKFLSCDWGTSSFRLRLVHAASLFVIAEEANGTGIAAMHKNWLASGGRQPERISFYQSFLLQQIKKLELKTGESLREWPVLLSGMASSSIGMMELPYTELPFSTEEGGIHTHCLAASASFPHPLIIISGARTADDVLRGEETLLIGADVATKNKESISIFPGTHSKHILVDGDEVKSFRTYMTGELFHLLSTQSILAGSLEKDEQNEERSLFFERGIIEGASANLLNMIFHVRTNQLFRKNTPKENYHYLSGLLIGAELKDLVQSPVQSFFLVCGKNLGKQYGQGLAVLGLHKKLHFVDADEALVKGQWRIYNQVKEGLPDLSLKSL